MAKNKKGKVSGGFFGGLVNDLLGLAEPELRKIAQGWAENIPEDSFLKKEGFERIFGYVRQMAERLIGKSDNPVLKAFGERLIDLGDIFSAEVSREGKETGIPKWEAAWLTRAQKRLAEAKSEGDLNTLKAQLLLEHAILKELVKTIEPPKSKKKRGPGLATSITHTLRGWNRSLAGL